MREDHQIIDLGHCSRSSLVMALDWPLIVFGLAGGYYAGRLPGGGWAWFSWHPLAMMVAFVALASKAVLVKKKGGYLRTKIHGNLLTLGLAVALFGWYVIYTNKNAKGSPHNTSWHAWVGVTALLSWVGLAIVGLLALHPDFGALKSKKKIRFAHKWGGRFATAMGWLACFMGFAKMNPNPQHQFLFGAPLLIASFFVLL